MNNELEVVLAQPKDAQRVVTIFREARRQMVYLPIVHTAKETSDYFTDLVEAGKIWVIKENHVSVGFMHAEGNWLHHLYIAPQFQKKGYGKLLLERAKEMNPTGLHLWVFEANTGAIRFYEREGFTLVEKRGQEETTNEEHLPDRKYQWNLS
jgi:GNAT superfamily N-acetyltransferase